MKDIVAIAVDFDGVVVFGTESLKRYAWIKMGQKDSRLADALAAGRQHLEITLQKKGSRFDILRKAAEVYGLSEGAVEDFVSTQAQKFDEIVQTGIEEIGILSSAREALEELSSAYPLYLNTATPAENAKSTLRNLNVLQFFKGVYGQPQKKEEILRRISAEERINPEQLLFVGDQDKDYQAAQAVHCQFVGVTNDWNKWEADQPFPLIFFLRELWPLLSKAHV